MRTWFGIIGIAAVVSMTLGHNTVWGNAAVTGCIGIGSVSLVVAVFLQSHYRR